MEISPSLLSYIFAGSTQWRISYEFPELTFALNGTRIKLNPEQVLEVEILKGWIWSTVTLKTLDQNFQFKGLFNSQAEKLQTEIYNDAEFLKNQRNAEQIKTALLPYLFEYQDFIQQNCYVSHYFTQLFKIDITHRSQHEVDRFNSLIQRDQSFAFESLQQSLFEQLKQFIEFPIKANYALDTKNKRFIESELIAFKEFFDQVETPPLTHEQRVSSIIFEDRNLLVAAAGSGKTSTIVGKVGYALLTGLYQPEEILVLAYNSHTGDELKERINLRLKDILSQFNGKVEALNFHKLGVRIIGKATGKSPTVSAYAENIKCLLGRIIQQLNETDSDFQEKYLLFKTAYLKAPLSPFAFKTQSEWDKAQKQSFDKDGQQAIQLDLSQVFTSILKLERDNFQGINLAAWKVIFNNMLYPLKYYYYQSKLIKSNFEYIIY